MSVRYEDLSAAEHQWIAAQLEAAARFVAKYSPHDSAAPLHPAALDRAFASWLAGTDFSALDPNPVINAVGVAFGAALIERAAFTWQIATDEAGTDLALLALPGRGDVLAYPANFVAKRWQRRESMFLESSVAAMAAQVAEVAAGNEKPKKPWWRVWGGPA